MTLSLSHTHTHDLLSLSCALSPSAQAEIAKLHATERAKLALREFEERELERSRGWADTAENSSAATNSPTGSLAGGASSPVAEERPGSPSTERGVRESSLPPSPHLLAAAAGGRSRSRGAAKRESNGGLFGWLVGKKPRTVDATEMVRYDGSLGPRDGMSAHAHQRYVA